MIALCLVLSATAGPWPAPEGVTALGAPAEVVDREAAADLLSPMELDAAAAALGEGPYADFCASCHGDAGSGDGPISAHMPAADLMSPVTCDRSDGWLYGAISAGGPVMPAMAHAIDPEVRWQIVAWLRREHAQRCPESDTAPTLREGWCGVVDAVNTQGCLTCHNTAAKLGGLDLSVEPGEALVGVPSSQWPEILRVAPGDPDASLLYQKLTGTQGPERGAQMPLGSQLDPAIIASVRAWIAAGAETVCDEGAP